LSRDPNLARQHPADYIKGTEVTIKQALATAKRNIRDSSRTGYRHWCRHDGSTPLPVDASGQPLRLVKNCQESSRDGLAVEGINRGGRGG